MKIKTYQSDSVTKALEKIKEDLGPDAVILNTKRTKRRAMLGLLPKMAYEITAATEPEAQAEKGVLKGKPSVADTIRSRKRNGASARPVDAYEVSNEPPRSRSELPQLRERSLKRRADAAGDAPLQPQLEKLAAEIERLKTVVTRRDAFSGAQLALSLSEDLSAGRGRGVDWRTSEEAAREMARLVSEGIDQSLAQSLLRFAISKRNGSSKSLRSLLREAVERMVETAPMGQEGQKAAIFIGPTGVGKTTTIAKLAAIQALGEQKRVQLITLDTYRIAAAEQLKTYADIIGVPVRVVAGIDELERAVAEASERDSVLIDTTGHSHKQSDDFWSLAAFLRERADIEKHLVLSVTTKSGDLREIIDGFGAFAPDRLVFTKLDETSTYGAVASEVILSGLPLSYVTDGQAVPDDIQVPTRKFIAELVVPR